MTRDDILETCNKVMEEMMEIQSAMKAQRNVLDKIAKDLEHVRRGLTKAFIDLARVAPDEKTDEGK